MATGVSDMQLAVGFDQIVKVLEDHLPSVEHELVYNEEEGRWHGIIRSADGLAGEGVGDTQALALKLGYNTWLETRIRALDSAGAADVAEALIRADSTRMGDEQESADSSTPEPENGGAKTQSESKPVAPPASTPRRPARRSLSSKGKSSKRGK